MRFSFLLQGIKPFSVNALYYGDGRTKTQKYYDWSFEFFSRLAQPNIQQNLQKFRDTFDPKKHAYAIKLTAYYPEPVFYKKAGGISAKTMDLSNWEKPLIDCLFLPKHHKNEPPYGSPNLNIDDRFITSLSSRKTLSQDDEHHIQVEIRLITLLEPCPRQESHKADPQCQPALLASDCHTPQSSQTEPQE